MNYLPLPAFRIGILLFAVGLFTSTLKQRPLSLCILCYVAKERLSFSKMTFTQQMDRLLLVEQVYRAMKIWRGEPYYWQHEEGLNP